MAAEQVKPDIHFLAIEQTEHWTIPEEFAPYVLKVLGIYSFNKNEHTYCCEITPSYWLEFHQNTVWTADETPEDLLEEIHEYFESVLDDDGGMYEHVFPTLALVDKLKAEPFRYYHLGEPPVDSEEYDSPEDYRRAVEEWTHEAYNTGSTSL